MGVAAAAAVAAATVEPAAVLRIAVSAGKARKAGEMRAARDFVDRCEPSLLALALACASLLPASLDLGSRLSDSFGGAQGINKSSYKNFLSERRDSPKLRRGLADGFTAFMTYFGGAAQLSRF